VRTRGLVVLLLGLAVVAVGCGGSSKQTTSLLHPSADGCDHSKPAAASTKRATFTKPETVLKPGEKAISFQVDRTTGLDFLFITLVAVILGGTRNVLLGAALGSLVLGLATGFAGFFAPAWVTVVVFALLIALLVARPKGLLA